MKFLFVIVAFSACMLATALAGPAPSHHGYGHQSHYHNDRPVNAAPVGHLESQRILASGRPAIVQSAHGHQVYGPSAVHVGPAASYGSGHGHDAQVQSLIKLALSLPTPKPDISNHGSHHHGSQNRGSQHHGSQHHGSQNHGSQHHGSHSSY